jgi:SAM-dependent methyltransferase
MSALYDHPKYYEIAFSFRDIPAEVDVFEECFSRFSRISVRSVLELGCGPSPHMEELVRRGYRYSGLDLNEKMLEYSSQKASQIGAKTSLISANMVDFSLETEIDFVYVLLGSLSVKNTRELVTHFDSVARTLRKGGLYLLDWCIQYDPPWESEGKDSWERACGGITVRTTISWKAVKRVEQTFEETITLDIDDHGRQLSVVGRDVKRAVYPQEFLLFISGREDFDFVGWWNNWDFSQPLEEAGRIDRPIALVRRT